MTRSPDNISNYKDYQKALLVFVVYWIALFVLYLPAANAGRVGDFPGWVNFLNSNNFTDYINRKGSGIPSMYQFTQIITYLFYRLFGANAWLWHVLYISLQAINAVLLFVFFTRLFSGSSVKNPGIVAFSGALLFCLTPYISEVVVWEPSFHYLLGLLLMLVVMICAQNFLLNRKKNYIWIGGIVFFLSSYSLEVFYLTPAFVLTLGIYYYLALSISKKTLRDLVLYFTIPQALIFVLHIVLLRVIYHSGIAHVGTVAIHFGAVNLSKSLKYLFHIVFLGRFFSLDVRAKVYHFCSSSIGLYGFYGFALLLVTYLTYRYKQMAIHLKANILLLLWAALCIGLILPLWFPETGLVIYDRYTYVADAFIFMCIALFINNLFSRYLCLGILAIYALINIRYTHKVNAYWQQSAHIVNRLVETFPNDKSKKVLLLNIPECLDGVQMIGTRDDGEFRMMYNALMPDKINNTVYDVEAYNMNSTSDGAHVIVVNDSTMKVVLNQWGTCWWYYGYGATSYENADYKVEMRDQGHWYDLILKHSADNYLLLFSTGDKWQIVDWSKKNVDQY